MSSRHYHSVSVSGKVDSCFLYTEHFVCFFVWSFFFLTSFGKTNSWNTNVLNFTTLIYLNITINVLSQLQAWYWQQALTQFLVYTHFSYLKKNCVSEKYKNRCIILPFSPMVSYFTDSLEHTAFSRKSNFVSINDRQMRQISATQVISK